MQNPSVRKLWTTSNYCTIADITVLPATLTAKGQAIEIRFAL